MIERGGGVVRAWRRLGYLAVAVVLALLAVFPRPYVARAKILPQDSSSAGLGQILNSLGGQLSTFASLLSGGRPPNDLYLIIGRSDKVTSEVIASLKLVGPHAPYATVDDAKIALGKRVDIHLLLGGVVEVETHTHNPDESARLTQAYVQAISGNVAALGRQTIRSKQEIVARRFQDATRRVAETARSLDAFRRENRLANAEAQLGSEISLRAQLQAKLQAKQAELNFAQQVSGPENAGLLQIQSDIATLRQQLAQTDRPSVGSAGPNISSLSESQSKYFDLLRDYKFAQALYDVYARASEQVSVEELVSANATYIQVVEPTHLDPERHYNTWAIALLVALALLAVFTELYAPATGLSWSSRIEESNDASELA